MNVLLITLSLALSADAPDTRPALQRFNAELLKQALTMQPEPPVGIYVQSDEHELARATASQLATGLATLKLAPVVIDSPSANDAENTARNHGVRSLIRVTVALRDSTLTARGDAISTWVNFWSGATPTRSGNAAVISVATPADDSAKTLAGLSTTTTAEPAAPLELKVSVINRLSGVPAALALGDVDADQHADIALLLNDELLVLRADGKLLARTPLGGALSPHPTRQPWGLLSIQNGQLLAWSARHAKPELFALTAGVLRSRGSVDEYTSEGMTLTLKPGFTKLNSQFQWFGKPAKAPDDFQTVQTRSSVTLMQFGDGSATTARGSFGATRFTGVGQGLTLADLDADDRLEVLTSSAHTVGSSDELKLFTLSAVEAVQSRNASLAEAVPVWQTSTARGLAVLAASADLDGAVGDEIVVITAAGESVEVLLLRSGGR